MGHLGGGETGGRRRRLRRRRRGWLRLRRRVFLDPGGGRGRPRTAPWTVVVSAAGVPGAGHDLEGGALGQPGEGDCCLSPAGVFVPPVGLVGVLVGEKVQALFRPDDPVVRRGRVNWAEQSLDFLSYKNSNEANRGNEYASGEKRSITLTGLTKGETFKVMARARYTSGGQNNGAWSGPWTETLTTRVKDDPPAAPTGLAASQVAHDSVTLTWTAPSRGTVTGYRVLRGTDANSLIAIAQDTGNAGTEYTDSTVAAETTYFYAVLALSAGRERGAVHRRQRHHAGRAWVAGRDPPGRQRERQ